MNNWVHPFSLALGWTLIHFLWQGALGGLVMALGLRLMRSRTAQARYLFACVGLLVMALVPMLTFVLQPGAGRPAIEIIREAGATLYSEGPRPLLQQAQAGLTPLLPWALGIWMAGVSLLSLRMLGAWVWLQRLRLRHTAPAGAEWHLRLSTIQRRLGLTRSVELLKSAAVDVPMVIGWLRPVILVPASAFLGLSPEALEAVLAHELAHIRRHDYLVNLVQSLIEILLFYHPAVWWLSAQIRTERENCCDDVAVAYCGDAVAYAKALAALEGLREPELFRTELALAADGGSLMHRIKRLVMPTLPPSPTRRVGLLAVLAVSVLGAGSVIRLKDPVLVPKTGDEKKTIVIIDDDRRIKVKSKGKVELKPENPEVVVLGEGGSFELRVKEGGKSRVFLASRDGKGETRTFTEDGQSKPLDAATKGWLKGQVEEVQKSQAATPPRHHVDLSIGDKDGKRVEKRIVIDSEKIAREVEQHMKQLEKHHGELEKHRGELERHKIFIERDKDNLKRHKAFVFKHGEASDLDLDFEWDEDWDEDVPAPPRIVMKPFKRMEGSQQEVEMLRSTIEQLQRRLERLERKAESGGVPQPPAAPRAPRAPRTPQAVPAPPPPPAPAPPAPPVPPAAQ